MELTRLASDWRLFSAQISTIHQPNAQKICEWLVDLDHSPAKKNPNDYILCGWLNLKID